MEVVSTITKKCMIYSSAFFLQFCENIGFYFELMSYFNILHRFHNRDPIGFDRINFSGVFPGLGAFFPKKQTDGHKRRL